MPFCQSLLCCCTHFFPHKQEQEIIVPKPQAVSGLAIDRSSAGSEDESQAGGGSQAGDRPAIETSSAGSENRSRVASETEAGSGPAIEISPAGSEEISQAGSAPKKNPFFKPGQDESAFLPFSKWRKGTITFKKSL